MKIKRKPTKKIYLGSVAIGGGSDISIQSMTNTSIKQTKKTIAQINELVELGCEIIRIAVKEKSDLSCLDKIRNQTKIPIEADIHFHYKLALEAIDVGVDGIRLNPGNIRDCDQIKQIVSRAKKNRLPIRVGLNSGSLPKKFLRFKNPAKAMVKAAIEYINLIESFKYKNLMVSLKASDLWTTIEANRLFSSLSRYPLHLGITASGLYRQGSIKSSIGLGILLSEGIGDTIRVSLASDPKEEVIVAKMILSSLGIRRFGPVVIACPTCGRCEINVEKIGGQINSNIEKMGKKAFSLPFNTIAVMGCVVNGPGEAQDADIAVCGGKKCGLIFKHGRQIAKVTENKIAEKIIELIANR